MTKEQANKVIDRLADKTLSFGCRVLAKDIDTTFVIRGKNYEKPYVVVYNYGTPKIKEVRKEESNIEVLGHPVMIGDCLAKMSYYLTIGENEEKMPRLVELWLPCGFTNSLQAIRDDAMWENEDPKGEIKYKPTVALFEFLDTLTLN